jgi:tetratricopeptide (TPR) repeat protein
MDTRSRDFSLSQGDNIMSALTWIRSLLGVEDRSSAASPERRRWADGVHHFMNASTHFKAGRDGEALACFDKAVDCGFADNELFEMRAMCLQKLGFDLDAIQDFNKAIAERPGDCHLYFMRSLSRNATCQYDEAEADLREAIRLSKLGNPQNANYHAAAKTKGHPSATSLYESFLLFNQVDLNLTDRAKQLLRARRQFKRRQRKS